MKKQLYLSNNQFRGKNRGDSRGVCPGKRNLLDDFDMSDSDIRMMKAVFDIIDTAGSGVILKGDLESTLSLLKADCEIGEKLLKGLECLDEITFHDFVEHVSSSRGNPKTKEGQDRIFDLIKNDEEKIDFDCLKRLCKELGDNMTDQEIQECIEKIAPRRGYITAAEFKRMMRRNK